jgi:hypothetical protein
LTWSDAEPAIIGDIAVVLHHHTDDPDANQRAAGERQAQFGLRPCFTGRISACSISVSCIDFIGLTSWPMTRLFA